MLSQRIRQMCGGLCRVWSCRNRYISVDTPCVQIGSGTQNSSLAVPHRTGYCPYRGKGIRIIGDDFRYLLHPDLQVFLFLQRLPHSGGIGSLICLRPEGMYRRSFGTVQHTALQEGVIDALCHLSPERVYFPHKMSL